MLNRWHILPISALSLHGMKDRLSNLRETYIATPISTFYFIFLLARSQYRQLFRAIVVGYQATRREIARLLLH
jgi:hypothetical protein